MIRSILLYIPNEDVRTIRVAHQDDNLVLPWKIVEDSKTSKELCSLILEMKRSEIESAVRILFSKSEASRVEVFERMVPKGCILDTPVEQVKKEVLEGKPIVVDIEGA